jgi:prephenate dehydrogenase
VSDATRVAIVGLGAIGGSAALKLVERGTSPNGFTLESGSRKSIVEAGIKLFDTVESAVAKVDLVLLAVPLDELKDVATRVLAAAPSTATILHASSLQRAEAVGLNELQEQRIIGTHPLAGSASAGFAAASAAMFHGATVYIEPRGTARNREDAELFWSMAGATKIEYLAAAEHDDRMAAVSHLPQLLATALAATLEQTNLTASALGPGGRDMTRLASSSWSMWEPLLSRTSDRTVDLLETLSETLTTMRAAIQARDVTTIESTWSRARTWREGSDQ